MNIKFIDFVKSKGIIQFFGKDREYFVQDDILYIKDLTDNTVKISDLYQKMNIPLGALECGQEQLDFGSAIKIEDIPQYFLVPSTTKEKLLMFCLKPEEMTGDERTKLARMSELTHWTLRYFNGNANPKWVRGHMAELAYLVEEFLENHPTKQ